MSTASQPTTFLDLYTDLQNRAREQTGITATENQAKRYINIALQDMHIGQGEKYPWAERSAVLVTQPQYTTGTVTITQGSTTLTGDSDCVWTTTNAFGLANARVGGKIVIDSGVEVYEVSSVDSATSITLTSKFVRDDVSDVNFVYFEDEYALARDFLRPIDQQKFDEGVSIDLVGRTEFRRRYPRNKTPGKPKIGTIIDKEFAVSAAGVDSITIFGDAGNGITAVAVPDTTGLQVGDTVNISGTTNYNGDYQVVIVSLNTSFGIQKTWVANDATGSWRVRSKRVRHLRLSPPPEAADMIRYHYVTSSLAVTNAATSAVELSGLEQTSLENDEDEPIVPLRYRHAIVFHALSHWYRDKKDDVRSQEAAAEYTRIMLRITADNEIGSARPQFRPRIGLYRRRASRPWRGGTGRYDISGKFDRLEW